MCDFRELWILSDHLATARIGMMRTMANEDPNATYEAGSEISKHLIEVLNRISHHLGGHGIHAPQPGIDRAIDQLKEDGRLSELEEAIGYVSQSVADALTHETFMHLPKATMDYVLGKGQASISERAQLAFPSVIDEFREASQCYAFEQWTACVFHLMRCLEGVTATLAKSLDPQLDLQKARGWSDYQAHIRDCLNGKVAHVSLPSNDPRRSFYEEMGADLKSVRIVWRNPTMHKVKDFDQSRAYAMHQATWTLIEAAATQVNEAAMLIPVDATS